MSQKTTKKILVSYSDDEDDVADSPPVERKTRRKHVEPEEDTASSGDGFINDEAEEDEESGSVAIESDNGHVKLKHSTPPIQRRRPAKYRVESDEEDEVIPKARHFRADDPASPKKKATATAKGRRSVVISDEDEDDNIRSSSKKATKERRPRRLHEVPSADEEDDDDLPLEIIKKSLKTSQKAPETPGKSKKQVKVEIASDSEVEFIEPPQSATKAKGNKSDSAPAKGTQKKTPVKSPKKKAPPKSKAFVDDSDDDIVVAASRLAPGDTMYPEKRASKVQPANLKRALPVTPPYQTRASTTVGAQATPSKKACKDDAPDNTVGDKDKPLGKKRVVASSLTKDNAKSKDEDGDDDDDENFDDLPPLGDIENSDDEDNNDADVFDAAPPPPSGKVKSSSTPVLHMAPIVLNQKYTDRRWSALPRPSACEVLDKNLLDEDLNALKSYDKLAPLRFCDIHNSGSPFNGDLTGTMWWSAWKQVLPERDIAKLVPLLEFQHKGRFINLSRVDPSILAGRYISDTRHEITVNDKTAICISVGCVRESALGPEARFGGPFISRGIRMVLHSFEWERWGSTIGEIARRPLLKTQLWNFAVTFATRVIRREDGPSSSRKVETLPSGFFNRYQSPKKQAATSSVVSLPNFVGQLEFTDDIPVYDARDIGKDFRWTASVFENPTAHFRLFDLFNNNGEIPSNALCAVGYVTQIYNLPPDRDTNGGKGKGKAKAVDDEPQDLRIAPLIQWVYVLGTL